MTAILTKIIIESILISGIIGFFFYKRESFFKKNLDHKHEALIDLLAPVRMLLLRSKIALKGYDANNTYRENILKECNEKIRDILLTKGHLIPTDLLDSSKDFISHYDDWLQHYNDLRIDKKDLQSPFVFTYNFPAKAEQKFVDKYNTYRKELKIKQDLS